MTESEVATEIVRLDMHGITVHIDAPGAQTRAALMYDYGMFAQPDDAAVRTASDCSQVGRNCTAELRVTVVEEDDAPLIPGAIAGLLGDTIVVGPGTVEVRGPNVTTRAAYLREIRPYTTASVIGLHRRRGAANVHASAVRARDGGVIFAGEKMAGKTSLVLAMVSAGYSYLSNDITLLLPGADGEVEVGGMPQALPMGTGTQQWFAAHVPEFGITAPTTIPEGMGPSELYWYEAGSKQRLGWEQISSRDELRLRTPLRHLVFPEAALDLDHPRVRPMDADEAATRLLQNVDYFLKWALGPQQPFADLVDATARLVERAIAGAAAIQFQWCPDHRRNAAVLAEHVGPPPASGPADVV
ncbi:MAG: hypothetical protein JWN03_1018 [Nocardia sp.]|uniref:hypothetical protein n=1 Tax=Nocardia sp. TaxID=1821 RepID=UPI002603F4C5|nr:hypothetical protein [Nocardia sp.]MCU1640743.1 hypothetical protein [Nocardia sp.]